MTSVASLQIGRQGRIGTFVDRKVVTIDIWDISKTAVQGDDRGRRAGTCLDGRQQLIDRSAEHMNIARIELRNQIGVHGLSGRGTRCEYEDEGERDRADQ